MYMYYDCVCLSPFQLAVSSVPGVNMMNVKMVYRRKKDKLYKGDWSVKEKV